MAEEVRKIDDHGLDILFRSARTFYKWQDKPVSDELIHELYELMKFGPTSANGSPARIVFLKSDEAKARLLPALSPLNVEKSRTTVVVAIVAYDLEFYEHFHKLFPHADAKSWYVGNEALILETALRNSSLQGAYLIMAARSLGLDCGPMSGFDSNKLNEEFFPDGKWKVNFIINIGYGDPTTTFPRGPRLDFNEACRLL